MKFLSNLRNRLRKRIANNERGQGMTEYILLMVIVVGIVLLFKQKIMGIIDSKVTKLGENIESVKPDNDH